MQVLQRKILNYPWEEVPKTTDPCAPSKADLLAYVAGMQ